MKHELIRLFTLEPKFSELRDRQKRGYLSDSQNMLFAHLQAEIREIVSEIKDELRQPFEEWYLGHTDRQRWLDDWIPDGITWAAVFNYAGKGQPLDMRGNPFFSNGLGWKFRPEEYVARYILAECDLEICLGCGAIVDAGFECHNECGSEDRREATPEDIKDALNDGLWPQEMWNDDWLPRILFHEGFDSFYEFHSENTRLYSNIAPNVRAALDMMDEAEEADDPALWIAAISYAIHVTHYDGYIMEAELSADEIEELRAMVDEKQGRIR